MRAQIYVSIFLICSQAFAYCDGNAGADEQRGFTSSLEQKLEIKLQEYVLSAAKWLQGINDRNLGNSELGRLMHYDEIKPKLELGRKRSMKKMSMGMMPLVFHVGATSTWMLITSLMAAKSVAIGIALLVFKIAVSSAKFPNYLSQFCERFTIGQTVHLMLSGTVAHGHTQHPKCYVCVVSPGYNNDREGEVASFFTALKSKQSGHHHHDWSWSPHYEHHGYERSLAGTGAALSHHDWQSYNPDNSEMYKTIPKDEFEESPPGLYEHERKTSLKKFT